MIRDWLHAYGDATVLVRGDKTFSAKRMEERAGEFENTAAGSTGALFIATDHAADIIAGLYSAERRSRGLVLGPGTLTPEETGELAHRLGVGTVVDRQGIRPISNRGGAAFDIALMSSGTTGARKVAHHTLASLGGRIRPAQGSTWLLTYAPAAFAGLQVVLTALASRSLLVDPPVRQPAEMVATAAKYGVTHVSGSPTFWRSWLMAEAAIAGPKLAQVTLGGEAVDQGTLDRLAQRYPETRIVHIYATTESGALFSVADRREGFPAAWLSAPPEGVQLRIHEGVLEVKSSRQMRGYLSAPGNPAEDGWFRTSDLVEERDDRVIFVGRSDDLVNIGGLKVVPEHVERLMLAFPGVSDAFVYAKKSPITGSILMAEIVCDAGAQPTETVSAMRRHLQSLLPRMHLPASIQVVPSIRVNATGKKVRTQA